MRCRECGLELDARDRLPNGAYQCPECGAIYHTASSSRVSPSPWRRRRRNPFGSAVDALTERHLGLPLWAWIVALAVVLVVALILLLNRGGGDGAPDDVAGADASSAPMVESTIEPSAPLEQPALDTEDELPEAPESTPITVTSTTNNTGVKLNDFSVGFDWAMSKLKYTDAMKFQSTEPSTTGEDVHIYTFQDWCTLQIVVQPDTQIIRSLTITTQLQEGSANNNRELGAMAATLYSLDNTITPNFAREQLVKMLANTTEYLDRTGFSANLTAVTTSEYTMQINGKL